MLLIFWILNWVGYKRQALHGLCPLSSAVVNILPNSGRRCHLPWLKWMIGIKYLINFVTSVIPKLPISPVHIVANTSFSHSKNTNLVVPPYFENRVAHAPLCDCKAVQYKPQSVCSGQERHWDASPYFSSIHCPQLFLPYSVRVNIGTIGEDRHYSSDCFCLPCSHPFSPHGCEKPSISVYSKVSH